MQGMENGFTFRVQLRKEICQATMSDNSLTQKKSLCQEKNFVSFPFEKIKISVHIVHLKAGEVRSQLEDSTRGAAIEANPPKSLASPTGFEPVLPA
jgi:hypothetical protein